MRLRSHYLLLAFSIVIPVALCCGIALTLLQDAQHSLAINRIEESASITAQVIDTDIERAQAVLKALANSHSLARADFARFHEEAREASARPGGWIILYDTNGQQLVNTRLPHGEALPARPDPGTVAAQLASGRGQVSGIRWGARLNNNFVMVEEPITTAAGKRYVIGQAFSPEFFAHTFAGRAIPLSWRVAILDTSGTFIARSERPADFVGKRVDAATQEVLRNSHTGVFKHPKSDGVLVYDAYTRSKASGWSVIVGAPVKEIDTAVWRGVSLMGAGLLVALAAALTLTMIAGRHLVRFVSRASQAASLLGQGGEVRALPKSAIFELERLNEAIREASGRLQDEMAQRARAEHERNLLLVSEKTARARAEEQNAAKDEFLAMLGHELRNPLSAVASAIAILDSARPVDAAMAARARDVVRRQTAQLRKLVDYLLEVNRALMGKLELDRAPVDLAEIARRCVDTLKGNGRCAGFRLHMEGSPVQVHADAARLMQVLDNLLDNALKYSPNGGEIAVNVAAEDDEAVLTVRDTGQGIARELLPKVFDIFVQGEQTLQRAHGGLGIGLSLVRRLVELHGGTVALDSAGPGLGTTATVRLPRSTATAVEAPASAPAPARRRRVMLVEDNDDARDMMTMLLELHDCEVVTAASGAEAVPLACETQPELAIIDIGLPGMDGYELARSLKADARTARIELIALTGYGGEKDREQALAAGFGRHFTKPIRIEDLQAALS